MFELLRAASSPSSSLLLREALAELPGVAAMQLLVEVDAEELDRGEAAELLVAWERCARWVAAQQARAVVRVAGAEPADADDFGREEVRVALLDCGGSPRSTVDVARALTSHLAAAGDALATGEISYDSARVFVTETACLDEATAAEVTTSLLGKAASGSPAQLRRRVRRAVIAADPVRAELASRRAARDRQISRRVDTDGQASLFVTGPAVDVATIWTALDARAARKNAADDRTLGARRFDALVAILRGAPATTAAGPAPTSAPATAPARPGSRPCVYLFADAATWAGLADAPVELDWYGPIPAGIARDYFEDSTWRAMVTDTVTGLARAVSDQTYSPSNRTMRHLHAQDRVCGFPGCGAAVWFCDVDHNTPHECGGETDTDNCGLFCRRHHRLKTFTRWRWRRMPDGTLEWTDPNGHRWHRDPYRYAMPHDHVRRRGDPPLADSDPPHDGLDPSPRRRSTVRQPRMRRGETLVLLRRPYGMVALDDDGPPPPF